ncbi:histidine kinase [Streptacidiphilus pinicola]|uniref:histidine kinase n=1 Tax=Streptacidiphilus pinicola TaxID=2219663 RepID=A0A2X0KBQ1_9ACTN|nr:HAMP domain-containing sensor histidine kinase [Streptacidiphilus pinicola]RAG84709.1 histidine kinase [Streptacidiphilus pinicola]
MRTRLLGILLALLACVLVALGVPLAASEAQREQQRVVVDRIDDAARFAALAQNPFGQSESSAASEQKRTLAAQLRRYHDVYGISVGVFDLGGHARYAYPSSWTSALDGASAEPFREALDGRRSHDPAQVWPWQGADARLVIASPVVWDGDVVAVVVTESPTDGLRERVWSAWLWLIGGEAFAVLFAVGVAVALTRWVLRPVHDLDKVTHDIATGRLASRVAPAGGPPELRRLARSFNEMVDHVELVLDQQRAFVADASHQLRNPLSALMLRVEVLGMELPEGHEEEMGGVRVEGRRLAQVLDDLLGLARAENARPAAQSCEVGRLAADRVEGWQAYARERGVALEFTAPDSPLPALADPVGLGSALDAVLDNALKFTPAGGTVRVETVAAGAEVLIRVTDGGPGLDEDELARIGDRFWRSPRHQNTEGSGLGLSIARALLTANGGGLGFAAQEPSGLTVTVSLPTA